MTAPIGVPVARIIELVAGRSDWIGKRLTRLDEVGHRLTAAAAVRPHAIDLPALCESWRVEYRETRATTVVARTGRSGRIVVSGAVEDARACQAALRRWLARRAKQTLLPWLESVSEETGLRFSGMGLKNQRTRYRHTKLTVNVQEEQAMSRRVTAPIASMSARPTMVVLSTCTAALPSNLSPTGC